MFDRFFDWIGQYPKMLVCSAIAIMIVVSVVMVRHGEMRKQELFDEGYTAAVQGIGAEECPYVNQAVASEKTGLWLRGWVHGKSGK